MSVSTERYRFAEQLYVFAEKSIEEIAEITGIPRRSLYTRAKTYKWASLRTASLRSPAVLVEEMYRELSNLNLKISQRAPSEQLATPQEAELRRKIIYSITAVKKFPSHAEVVYIMQSLLRYAGIACHAESQAVAKVVDGFLSHKDMYGYTSYQPEHKQDLHAPTAVEMRERFNGPEDLSDPDDVPHPEDILLPGQSYIPSQDTETNTQSPETQAPLDYIVEKPQFSYSTK